MENEKEERQSLEENETIEMESSEKGNWKNLKTFLFAIVLFMFAYWLGANRSQNDNLLGQIYEKGVECIGNMTLVSEKEQEEEIDKEVMLNQSILDQEDTSMTAVQPQETDTNQEQSQILQYEQDKNIPKFHIVAKGDTLRSISMYYYGDYGMIDAICQMNQIEDSNCIECGQTLFLP